MQHVFTANEIDALIPTLQGLVSRQLEWAKEINALLKSVQTKTGVEVQSMEQLEAKPEDSSDLVAAKTRAKEAILRYEDGWTDVQDLGAVVKDPRAGVLDFWGTHEGRYVWMTWGFGDSSVSYFHELDAPVKKPMARSPLRTTRATESRHLN
jgi:hypothetical protein